MSGIKEHYDQVLSDVYAWMFGGIEQGIASNLEFFRCHGLTAPTGSGIAVDLGAGCGFQSIPLAQTGFAVTAMDINARLLRELEAHAAGLDIRIIEDDMLNAGRHVSEHAELIVCMTDTLAHLESREDVAALMDMAFSLLEDDGRFIVTFRDQSSELQGTDRFIPVRSDENTILTCFLEYGAEKVTVHDLVYRKENNAWQLRKSSYQKLRLKVGEVEALLRAAGFSALDTSTERGMTTIIARKAAAQEAVEKTQSAALRELQASLRAVQDLMPQVLQKTQTAYVCAIHCAPWIFSLPIAAVLIPKTRQGRLA